MPHPLRVRASLGWQAKACPTHCGTGSKKQSGEPVPEPTRGTGDRQDCQRNSGKRRRKFMAVLSVPGATRRNGVRASLGWQAKACPTHCASELRSDGKLKHAPPTAGQVLKISPGSRSRNLRAEPGTGRTASEIPAKGAGNSWQTCQSPGLLGGTASELRSDGKLKHAPPTARPSFARMAS